jgi:hypothetical protein
MCYRKLLLNRNGPRLYTHQSIPNFSCPSALSLPSYLSPGPLLMPGFLTKHVYAFLTSPYMICACVTRIILDRMYELQFYSLRNFSFFITNGLSIRAHSMHSSVLKHPPIPCSSIKLGCPILHP